MSKRSLSDWASIAEIVGTIAVVISLLFVGHSIQRNTVELQTVQANDLYDALREIEIQSFVDPEMARIVMAAYQDQQDELSPLDLWRLDQYNAQTLSIWEQADLAYQNGTISKEEYDGWKEYFLIIAHQSIGRRGWERIKPWFNSSEINEEMENAFPPGDAG